MLGTQRKRGTLMFDSLKVKVLFTT